MDRESVYRVHGDVASRQQAMGLLSWPMAPKASALSMLCLPGNCPAKLWSAVLRPTPPTSGSGVKEPSEPMEVKLRHV